MLMNGRGGSVSLDGSGGWSSGGGSSLPQNLTVDSRSGNQPPEYKASYSIEFIPGFNSGDNDEFTAYITSDNSSGGSGGSTGGTGSGTIAENSGYRYGFNGKENDNEVKGEGAQQDYGMRIYDPRLGRFLSVDPISKDYPELTPYQFGSDRPIDGIDQDGLEYVSAIPKFNQNTGNWLSDHISAIDNGVIDVLNIIPSTWNSAVSSYQSLNKGTYLKDLGSETKQVAKSVKQNVVQAWNHPLKTLNDPATLEFGVSVFVGSKIPLPGLKGKGNLLKSTNAEDAATGAILKQETTSSAAAENEVLAAKYTKNRPSFRQGAVDKVWEAAKDINGKVYDPNTFEELTWDKFKSRYNQWHMGHKPGFEYRDLVDKLRKGTINQKEFLVEYNNPNNYRPESPAANMSHKYEATKNASTTTSN